MAKEIRRRGEAPMPARTGGDGMSVAVAATDIGAVGAVAREESMIRAQCVMARQFKRNEADVREQLLAACERPGFAADARYVYPRGDAMVSGPSAPFAREAARLWGNIRFGLRLLAVTDDEIHIEGFAFDLQTNAHAELEDRFRKAIQRKRGGETTWIQTTDERELRELINRRGAICQRNAILSLLPPDMVEECMALCAASGSTKAKAKSEADRVPKMVTEFGKIGVTRAVLEKYLGMKLERASGEELNDLAGVYRAIVDGATSIDSVFVGGVTAAAPPAEKGKRTRTRTRGVEGVKEKIAAEPDAAEGGGNDAEPEPSVRHAIVQVNPPDVGIQKQLDLAMTGSAFVWDEKRNGWICEYDPIMEGFLETFVQMAGVEVIRRKL